MMANKGVITAKDVEGCTLYIKPEGSANPIPYRFDVPYTTAKGEQRNGCAYLINKLNVGDEVEYTYGRDNYGSSYLKFAKKVDGTTSSPSSFNTRSQAPPTQTMGKQGIDDQRQHIIIYQHCQKVAVDLVIADDRIELHDRCSAVFDTAKIIYDDICKTFGIESKVRV